MINPDSPDVSLNWTSQGGDANRAAGIAGHVISDRLFVVFVGESRGVVHQRAGLTRHTSIGPRKRGLLRHYVDWAERPSDR